MIKNKITLLVHNNLNINESLYLKVDIPCGIPKNRVVFEKYDYTKASFDIGFDGRFGGMFKNDYKCKVGLKTFLYYLFR